MIHQTLAGTFKQGEGYSPAVIVDGFKGKVAFVYQPQGGAFTKAGALERATDAANDSTWINDQWVSYTNSDSTVEWLRGEGFEF